MNDTSFSGRVDWPKQRQNKTSEIDQSFITLSPSIKRQSGTGFGRDLSHPHPELAALCVCVVVGVALGSKWHSARFKRDKSCILGPSEG